MASQQDGVQILSSGQQSKGVFKSRRGEVGDGMTSR